MRTKIGVVMLLSAQGVDQMKLQFGSTARSMNNPQRSTMFRRRKATRHLLRVKTADFTTIWTQRPAPPWLSLPSNTDHEGASETADSNINAIGAFEETTMVKPVCDAGKVAREVLDASVRGLPKRSGRAGASALTTSKKRAIFRETSCGVA